MDTFFTQTHCDRCHQPLNGARIMSAFNTDCICMDCKNKERQRPDYREALEAERAEIKKGNYDFKGIGYREEV